MLSDKYVVVILSNENPTLFAITRRKWIYLTPEEAKEECIHLNLVDDCFNRGCASLDEYRKKTKRFYIDRDECGYAIVDRQNYGYVAHFKAVQHPSAKEAAQAECDRLNAEHRKEQQ